ncbi:uncharacterized protein LOC119968719 isoform X1 [Scyliorhinus canicula]|uniref:uncharacterized protein LOC119968719 isoform X1 n=1 Tax=Scyliorhinus canicula TaxID=7830 RepID=UPI0018F5DC60|nr:uncharacterized protein LOC119968719 isoform X1 [Scyliorhinus canicula]
MCQMAPQGFGGGHRLPVAVKVMVTLNICVSGSLQGSSNDLCGISDTFAHRFICAVMGAIFARASDYIAFSLDQAQQGESLRSGSNMFCEGIRAAVFVCVPGSSHTVDQSTAFPGADNTEYRVPQDSRNTPFHDRPSSSLCLTPPYPTNNNFSNPDPYYWQALMNTYALQQYHINSQMVQQQQQQQYYQAMAQQVGLAAQMPHFSPVSPDFMARSHPPAWDNWQPRDPIHGNCCSSDGGGGGGGGQARESDSDSDSRSPEKLPTTGKQRERQYKKHKSKKKKH